MKQPSDYARLVKYKAKYLERSDTLPTNVIAQKELIEAHQKLHFANFFSYEQRTRTLLDAQGISTTLYPFFLSFSRQVYRLSQQFSGESLLLNVNILLLVWVGRGLTQAILETIRDDVWHIDAPAP